MMNRTIKKKLYIGIPLVLLVLGLGVFMQRYAHRKAIPLTSYAQEKIVIADIQSIAKTKGAKVAYDELKAKYATNQTQTHDLAHVVGRIAYDQLGAQGFAICDANFAFGCYHGLLEELITKQGLGGTLDARAACNSLSPRGQVISCLHGIGHGVMGYRGNLTKALTDCAAFSADERTYCYDGSYMEYYSGVMLEGAKELAVSIDKPWAACSGKLTESQPLCVRNHLFYLLYTKVLTSQTLPTACTKLEATLQTVCVQTSGLYATQTTPTNDTAIQTLCNGFPTIDNRALCTTHAAQELVFQNISIDRARALCQSLPVIKQPACTQVVEDTIKIYGK